MNKYVVTFTLNGVLNRAEVRARSMFEAMEYLQHRHWYSEATLHSIELKPLEFNP
jgi:hypothetical protein